MTDETLSIAQGLKAEINTLQGSIDQLTEALDNEALTFSLKVHASTGGYFDIDASLYTAADILTEERDRLQALLDTKQDDFEAL